ncbi:MULTISPECIES: ArsC/Spx/MgsR family protein [Clostridium]|jgi:arsenate reductase (glutaredoxin)|uniref:Arsenate reductase n=1 Tax=Clostridium sartagoforme AAU1 TaxID=1202534 RepID=R9CDP8_9CLOT|nr:MULTISPECIES: ArsC/Spx/MgsR family protein [Clostridium]EOR27160.1 arsenate reductase [Clostridium sartagoforme AAU1]KLE16489.1 ArsC family transcriptional regulator [Clostridium sp. C8]
MNIQIFGRKKCFDTKKAERYFKERNINFQFIDIDLKGLSKGELNSVKKSISINELINKDSKDYRKLNLDKIRSNDMKEEILLKNPKLFISPIVRNSNIATLGYKKEIWDTWE